MALIASLGKAFSFNLAANTYINESNTAQAMPVSIQDVRGYDLVIGCKGYDTLTITNTRYTHVYGAKSNGDVEFIGVDNGNTTHDFTVTGFDVLFVGGYSGSTNFNTTMTLS